jgi:uncharacterized RDD family membrane protein YckC
MTSDAQAGANEQNPVPGDLSHPFIVKNEPMEAALRPPGDEPDRGASWSRGDFWRQEIVNRVEGYRHRRARKTLSGQFSMRFDFGPAPAPLTKSEPEPGHELKISEANVTGITSGAACDGPPCAAPSVPREIEFPHVPAKRDLAQPSRILQFPRPHYADGLARSYEWDLSAATNELAEPILHKPRIIDVPETVAIVPPALADVALPTTDEEDEIHSPEFELPPPAASLFRRLAAALIDLVLIGLAILVFALIVMRGSHPAVSLGEARGHLAASLAAVKPFLGLAVIAPLLFWSAYHYLFLVHAAATPGMSITHLRISTFDGRQVQRATRRWRALLMVLSCASLGLGFAWALFDQDVLCWHDRMTRTCLTASPRS